MSDSKSVCKCFSIFFSKKNNRKKLLYKSPKVVAVANTSHSETDDVTKTSPKIDPEAECDFVSDDIESKMINLKRHTTLSVDLSDKTLRLINSEQLTKQDSVASCHRTSSFNFERDFLKKMLPITDFEEKEVLGEGAFGRAIKVKHVKSGCFFVLKEVISHSKENEESIIREVALLRSLKHNNILTTIGLVLKDKSICLLTELMHGGSLQAKILNLDENISINQKLLFLRDIAAGMTFLHQHSIMHRDLTSSNCLLRKDNTVVVSDFGLSKFLNDDNDSVCCSSAEIITDTHHVQSLTSLELDDTHRIRNFQSEGDISDQKQEDNFHHRRRHNSEMRRNMKIRRKHTVVGNPFWMAPEMLAGRNYNCLVDLYSFGVIGCEVTARVSAHPDHLERKNRDMSVDFDAFLEKHKPRELATCPDELIELVRKCCDTDSDKRPSFNSLLSWIEDLMFRLTNNVNLKMKWSEDR